MKTLSPQQKKITAAGWTPARPPHRGSGLFPEGCWRHARWKGPHTLAVALLLSFAPEPAGKPFADFSSIEEERARERQERRAIARQETERLMAEARERQRQMRRERSLR